MGSDSTLVAPITVEDGAYIGAGSCITKNVPAGALAVGRARQMTKEGWAGGARAKLRNANEARSLDGIGGWTNRLDEDSRARTETTSNPIRSFFHCKDLISTEKNLSIEYFNTIHGKLAFREIWRNFVKRTDLLGSGIQQLEKATQTAP